MGYRWNAGAMISGPCTPELPWSPVHPAQINSLHKFENTTSLKSAFSSTRSSQQKDPTILKWTRTAWIWGYGKLDIYCIYLYVLWHTYVHVQTRILHGLATSFLFCLGAINSISFFKKISQSLTPRWAVFELWDSTPVSCGLHIFLQLHHSYHLRGIDRKSVV